jgi:hypothetical protein
MGGNIDETLIYDKIKIIDNFLPTKQLTRLQHLVFGDECDGKLPFKFGCVKELTDASHKNLHNWLMIHNFYIQGYQTQSKYYGEIMPILDLIKPLALIRARCNMMTSAPEKLLSNFHIDYSVDGKPPPGIEHSKCAIFYLNTTNGPTVFKDGTEVECIENRLVEYPTTYYHAATLCTDTKVRVVINLNYF